MSTIPVIAGYAAKVCFPKARRLGLIVPALGGVVTHACALPACLAA